ncbi:substrate-binding periplasmic protein [Chitinimonas koreensis]|uniref:substrate-binding periplasmic protein n=1 Tax=Chitinimonas koreensis TaxID=356302 RepID=UPI0003F705E3|nr:transporter substrate-binding domain-containing protein [Chitinimonas koreensis]QNM97407.1 hypothetical protein H9L41_03590 [Chitinimonas koreensis]
MPTVRALSLRSTASWRRARNRLLPALLPLLLLGAAQAREQLTVCFDDWAPYAAFTPDRGYHGLTLELMREVFAELDVGLRFQSATQSRCAAAARAGKIDVMLFADRELLPAGWRSTQVPTEFWLVGAWVQAGSPQVRYERIEQFRGARVAMVTDYLYPEPIAGYRAWRPVMVGDAIDGLRQLSARRVDVQFEDVLWGRDKQRELGLKIRLLQPLVAAQPQLHWYHPDAAPLMQRYEQAVQALIRGGELEARYRAAIGLSYDAIRRGDYGAVFVAP